MERILFIFIELFIPLTFIIAIKISLDIGILIGQGGIKPEQKIEKTVKENKLSKKEKKEIDEELKKQKEDYEKLGQVLENINNYTGDETNQTEVK